MTGDTYVAPAARVLTVLHTPGEDGVTACCGQRMDDPQELWVEVQAKPGDRRCSGGWGEPQLFGDRR